MKRNSKYADHNQSIFELQQRLKAGDPHALGEMYRVFFCMARRMVTDYARRHGLPWRAVTVHEKAHDIAARQIELFLRHDDYTITKSPSGLLRNGVWLRVMYSEQKHDQVLSWEELTEEYDDKDLPGVVQLA